MQSETQIDYIAEAIEETFGERCPDYSDGCPTCEAWKRFDYLESLAALSTDAEPVAWMDDGDTRNGSTSNSFRVVTAETKAAMPRASADNFNTPLYAAPPAPSVAVKALHQAASDFMHLFIHDGQLTVQGLEDTDLIPAYEKLSAALSAQVQDVAIPVAEIVEAKTPAAQQIYGFDIRFFDALRGLPIGTKLYASSQVQDLEGWHRIETAPKDGTVIQAWHTVHKCPISILWNKQGHDFNGEELHWFERSYTTAWPEHAFSHWMPLPAAPAKQEGGESNPVHKHSVDSGESGDE